MGYRLYKKISNIDIFQCHMHIIFTSKKSYSTIKIYIQYIISNIYYSFIIFNNQFVFIGPESNYLNRIHF